MAVCVVALVRPIRAVTRGDHLPLWKAWLVHLVGAGLTAAVMMVLALDYITFENIAMRWWIFYEDDLPPEIPDEVMTWTAVATKAIFIEASVLVFAAVVMSWCARDEKIRESYTRALRRLFLLTPHAAMVFALTGLGILWLDRSEWTFYEWYGYGEMARFLVFFVACLWTLWVVLAALGCRSAPAMSRWPARCEGCGYQLTGLTTNKDCPECGLAIMRSLEQCVRPGITPHPRMGIGWWLHQTHQAVRRPTAFGKSLDTLSPESDHRRCLAVTIVLLILASPIAMDLMYRSALLAKKDTYRNWSTDWEDIGWDFTSIITLEGGCMGLPLTATTVVVVLGGATLIGLIEGWRHGRNLMPAAIRAACYQSGFAVFWAVIFWLGLEVFVVGYELNLMDSIVLPQNFHVYHLIVIPYNIYVFQLVGLWRLGVAALGITIYLWLIYRATHAARFANW